MDGNPPSQSDRSERVDLVRDRLTFISQALLVTTVIIGCLGDPESVFKPFFIAIALFLGASWCSIADARWCAPDPGLHDDVVGHGDLPPRSRYDRSGSPI